MRKIIVLWYLCSGYTNVNSLQLVQLVLENVLKNQLIIFVKNTIGNRHKVTRVKLIILATF